MQTYIQGMKNGDQAVMDEVIDLYYPQIYQFVYRTMGGDEVTKDITQEVFIRFLAHLDHYPDDLALKPYLFQIAFNRCKDQFRKRKRMAIESELVDVIKDERANPPEQQIKQQRGERVKQAIDHLPFDQRTAVLLRYYHQLKFKEIASMLDVSESTIKSRITLAMTKLRKELEEDASWMIG